MKNTLENNNLAELRPTFKQEPSAYIADDEISLIDLTLVLLRRKWLIAITLGLCLVAGIIASMFSATTSTGYSTTIKIGTQIIDNRLAPLESPETLLAKINHSFIPQTLNEFQQPYSISASIPKKSDVILLNITAQSADDTSAVKLLNSLTQKIEQDHDKIYTAIKHNLSANLKPVSIEAFAAQTASIQKTYAVSEPIKSSTTSRLSSKLILVLSLVGGLFLGVFAAFFAEFWAKVREQQERQG